jgi:formate dehydrogenase maturation protein FdhE
MSSEKSANRSDSDRLPSDLLCPRCQSLGAKAVQMSGDVWPGVQYYRCAKCGHLWSIRVIDANAS